MWIARTGILSSGGSSSLLNGMNNAWTFENNANDLIGGSNGIALGGVTYISGKNNLGASFNGSNGIITLADNSLNYTSTHSFSMWVKANASGNYGLVSNYRYTGSNYGYSISLRGNDLYYQILTPSNIVNLIYTNASGWTSQYNHIYVEREWGIGSKIYVNNILVASNTSTINPQYTTTHYPTIGNVKESLATSYWYYNGIIDELYKLNRKLTYTELTDLQTKYYPF